MDVDDTNMSGLGREFSAEDIKSAAQEGGARPPDGNEYPLEYRRTSCARKY